MNLGGKFLTYTGAKYRVRRITEISHLQYANFLEDDGN